MALATEAAVVGSRCRSSNLVVVILMIMTMFTMDDNIAIDYYFHGKNTVRLMTMMATMTMTTTKKNTTEITY